jgi:uncharacterized protein
MTLKSCIYRGWVMHSRCAPLPHRFKYRIWWMLVDLDELPELRQSVRLFSHNRFNVFALHDADYGNGKASLRTQVEERLVEAGLASAAVRIQLLTMPRLLGYAFNPLSIYFCSDAGGRLAAIIYEVHNTFGERHSYVIKAAEDTAGLVRQEAGKAFYVSPFMDMSQDYSFSVRVPGEKLSVAITGSQDGAPMIHTSMRGTRTPLSSAALQRLCLSHPLVTLKVIGGIHWEALRIWRKGVGIRPRSAVCAHSATVGYPAAPAKGSHG